MPNPSEKVSEGEGVAGREGTPGPWKTGESAEGIGVYGCGFRVARMTGGELRRDQANARLIAAAPCLAEALRGAADMCAVYADFIRNHVTAEDIEVHPYLPALEDVIETARTALSRLTPSKE